MEEWKQLSFSELFIISSEGTIKNIRGNYVSNTNKNVDGFNIVKICTKFYFVHKLVYKTFVGGIEKNMIVIHKDGDKQNNKFCNLVCVKILDYLKILYGSKWSVLTYNKIRGYFISHDGKIWSKHSQSFRKQSKNNGYLYVNIQDKTYAVHRLVVHTFLQKQKGRQIVNHKDGDKTNNNLNNLEFCSHKENSNHSVNILGRGNKKGYKYIKSDPRDGGKEIDKYPGYIVYDNGDVYSKHKGHYLKPTITPAGYTTHNILLANKKRKRVFTHILVADCHLEKKDHQNQVNHKDRNRANNCVINLEWVTQSENMNHCFKYRKQTCKEVVQINIHTLEIINIYNSCKEASYYTNFNMGTIKACCLGKLMTCGGFNFQYLDKMDTDKIKNYVPNNRKKVYMISFKSREIINEFDSCAEAQRKTQIDSGAISNVCIRKTLSAGGYFWSYSREYSIPKTPRMCCGVNKIDPKTGDILSTYGSIKEAAEKNSLDRSAISKVCRGKLKMTGGFIWNYDVS